LREKAREFVRDLALGCISSVLLYLSHYPANLSFIAWVALVPWFVLISRRSPGRAALILGISGYVHFLLSISWIGVVTYSGLFTSCIILAGFAALFGWLYSYATGRLRIPVALAGPVLWVAVEYARSNFFFLAFPWVLAGHSQHAVLPLIQIADITGVFGVSFIVALLNAAIAQGLLFFIFKAGTLRRLIAAGAVAAGVLALTLGYGFWRLGALKWEEGPAILVVQGNVPQELKEASFKEIETLGREMKQEHIKLSTEVFRQPAQLVVWPETMWPGFLLTDPEGFAQIAELARQANAHILIGTQRYVFENGPKRRNSAVLITPRGRTEARVYDKIFLVPVSEYVPLADVLVFIKFIISQMLPYEAEPLTHGASMEVFDAAGSKFSVVICFELSLDWLVRKARNAGADYIINISNDGWFAGSAELDMAVVHGVFRAIENRMGVVRAVNTGISCFIDPAGRATVLEVKGKRKQVPGVIHGRVGLAGQKTVFSSVGGLFGQLNLLLGAALALYMCIGFVQARLGRAGKFTRKMS